MHFCYATNTCIFVLAPLFCRGGRVTRSKTQICGSPGTICNDRILHEKKKQKVGPLYFDKRPIPKFNSFASAIPIMDFPTPRGKVKVLPFWAGCGRGGMKHDSVFTCYWKVPPREERVPRFIFYRKLFELLERIAYAKCNRFYNLPSFFPVRVLLPNSKPGAEAGTFHSY